MEENKNNIQPQLFFKYLIEFIQKQQHDKPNDFSTKITKQSSFSLSTENHLNKQDSIVKPVITPEKSSINQDNIYWERRRKNNEAAKRSRDARRAKEDEIAIR